MALRLNKKCIICGEEYRYCVNCRDNKPYQYWRNVYCSEDCKDVGEVWYAYRGKEISQKDAKTLIERHSNVVDKINTLDTPIAKEIKDICSYAEKVEEPIQDVSEKPVETVEQSDLVEDVFEPAVESVVEEQPKKTVKANYNKNKKNNYKGQ